MYSLSLSDLSSPGSSDLPVVLDREHFGDSLATLRAKIDESRSPDGPRYVPNVTRRQVFATTTRVANDAKAISLRDRVSAVYREAIGSDPADALFTVSFSAEPETGVERTEYGTASVVVCPEAGLQILKDGVWYSITEEQSTRGVVLAGAFHPVLPATRYRFSNSVAGFIVVSVEPSFVDERTRARYEEVNANRNLV